MEQFKLDFVDFLLKTNAGKFGEDRQLKNKRLSPHFINIGDFNDGETTAALGSFYAHALKSSGVDFDLLYGIPEKGVGLAIAASMELARLGVNKPWFFTRKVEKTGGEASTQAEKIKGRVVGRAPKDGNRIAHLDDVFTTGDAKYQAIKDLGELGTYQHPVLAIAVDRQEVGIDGVNAIEKYEKDTGTKVVSVLKISEIYEILKGGPEFAKACEMMANYLRVYGTQEAKIAIGVDKSLEHRVIAADKSVIPACDVETIEQFEELVKQTADLPGIGGFKVGFELGLAYGLPRVVEVVRKYTDKPIIYDHQKAATDIPDTGKKFARVCKNAGIDTVIFFPEAGPETERAWIYHALNQGLKVIVGGRMTHPAYAVSEGGFITDEGATEMYRIAARAGVNNFVVPGNKPDVIKSVRNMIEAEGVKPVFYAPGFIAQGGRIDDATKAAGDSWHAIVGTAIYTAENMRKAAEECTSKIVPKTEGTSGL